MEIDAVQCNTKMNLKIVVKKILTGLTWFTVGASAGSCVLCHDFAFLRVSLVPA